jgi:hypothetical protein
VSLTVWSYGAHFHAHIINSIAVAYFYNGTVINLAKVPATPAYRAFIEPLGNATLLGPPSYLAKWKRWLNKKRGLAATADVEVLAFLLIMLKSATLDALAQSIDRVAVTQPSIPALTQEDLKDALEYADLRSVSQYASTDAFLEADSISSYFS